MYGDCQVMSTMGGNVVSSETLFSSPPIQNSNYNFMSSMPFQPFPPMIAVSFHTFTIYIYIYVSSLHLSYMSLVQILLQKEENGFLRGKDEMDSGSGSEQVEEKSATEQESEQPPKKKRYHRHTARQIQEMEAYVQY